MLHDKSLKSFFHSYLRHRERPGFSREATASVNQNLLETLDKSFVLLVTRMSFLVASGDDTDPRNAKLADECCLLAMPSLASLFSIAGDSNRPLATKVMKNLHEAKNTAAEFSVMISDSSCVLEKVMEESEELASRLQRQKAIAPSESTIAAVLDIACFCQDMAACFRLLLLALPRQMLSESPGGVLAAGGLD